MQKNFVAYSIMYTKNSILYTVHLCIIYIAMYLSHGKSAEMEGREYNKPQSLHLHEWIELLEEQREKALKSDYIEYERITKEICATLGGKYIGPNTKWRKATEKESKIIFEAVKKTRQHYSTLPDIFDHFYFAYNPKKCNELLKHDQHYYRYIQKLIAVDVVSFVIKNSSHLSNLNIRSDNLNMNRDSIKTLYTLQHSNLSMIIMFLDILKKIFNEHYNDTNSFCTPSMFEFILQNFDSQICSSHSLFSLSINNTLFFLSKTSR